MIKIYKTNTLVACFVALLFVIASQSSFSGDKKSPEPLPRVKFETTSGDFVIELYPDKAPVTVANFLQYIDEGFYVGTIFHRVVPNFVIQGGGFNFEFQRKETRDPIINESDNGLDNEVATLSMARTSDPGSATSQFFINLKHNEALDYSKKTKTGYAVFGKIVEGFETARKIEREPRGTVYRSRPEAPNFSVIVEATYRLQ